ncbi:MAG TPA: serine hydrolase [Terriglobales bacterium]|nr:serine hydrolase [Terriglobales bacterium]
MKHWAIKHPFPFFYLLAVAIAAGVMVVYGLLMWADPSTAGILPGLFASVESHQSHVGIVAILRYAMESRRWAVLLILVFASAPTVSALLTSAITGGGSAVRRWLARLKPWGPQAMSADALPVYFWIFAIYFATLAIYLGLTRAYAPQSMFARMWASFGSGIPTAIGIAILGAFMDEGGTLEEMGWRGFAFPLLQEKLSPLSAAVGLGFLWYAWHLPREIPTLIAGVSLTSWGWNQAIFALLCVALSIVMGYAVNRTGGSVLPAILIHGGTNVWSKAASQYVNDATGLDVRTWVVILIAGATGLIAGPSLGRRRPPESLVVPDLTVPTWSRRFRWIGTAFLAVVFLLLAIWTVAFPTHEPLYVETIPQPVWGPPVPAGIAQAVQQEMSRYLVEMQKKTGAPGLSATVVLPDGQPVTVAVGYADVEAQKPLTPDTLLLGGSTGKTYCAATVMLLVEKGQLSLDDRVSKYLGKRPWFSRIPNADALTVRILLTHTGGLPQFLDIGAFERRFIFDALLGKDTGYSPDTMLSFLVDQPALNAPGVAFHYSDLGYMLLGQVVEEVTGKPYYEVLQQQVLNPLGLTWIRPSNTTRIPGLAVGYVKSDWETRLVRTAGPNMTGGVLRLNPALEYTGGGLANTPLGLALFFKQLLEGRLLDSEHVALMTQPAIPSPSIGRNSHYGFGLLIVDRPGFGRYFTHSGWYPGYLSNVAYFRDYRFSVAIQANTDRNVDIYTPVRDIASIVLRAMGKPVPRPD